MELIATLLPVLIEQCKTKSEDVPRLAEEARTRKTFGGRLLYLRARRLAIRQVGRDDYLAAGGDAVLDAVMDAATVSKGDEIASLYCSLTADC